MLKKINLPYLIFSSFVLFILFSFYFILKTNENTKNNYFAVEKIEILNLLNKKLDNTLSKKLQYIDANAILMENNRFADELKVLKEMLLEHDKDFSAFIRSISIDYKNKERFLNQFITHNYFLDTSMQELLKLQAYIQKRYYFSPIGLEVNSLMVNFMQTALGKTKDVSLIKENIKRVENLKKLYKLADPQLTQFIENSYLTLAHINNLANVTRAKNKLHLDVAIQDLEIALVNYFKKQSKKEKIFSYILIFIIICFLITLIITYEIDKKHKKKLLEQTRKLNEAQEFAHFGSWDIDFIENEIYFSKELYKICDIDSFNKKITFKTFISLIHPTDRIEIINTIKESQEKHFDGSNFHKLLTSKGNVKYVENIWHNQYDENDNLVKTFGVILDITNAKKLEAENKKKEEIMYQQSKMVAMGEMIGNIAHQWRQPLSVISTSATGAKLQKEFGMLNDEKFNETMDQINDNAQYLSQTIDDFRNFIKGDKEVISYELRDTISSFLHLVHPSIKNHHITTILALDEKMHMKGRPSELIQCFINIFSNAKDAFKEKDITNNRLMFISAKKENKNIIIKFKDNAGGIPKDIIGRIFEPYFTTKHKSQGTGIGLHMTYNIIIGLNGKIEVTNVVYTYQEEEYKGAQFVITLPCE